MYGIWHVELPKYGWLLDNCQKPIHLCRFWKCDKTNGIVFWIDGIYPKFLQHNDVRWTNARIRSEEKRCNFRQMEKKLYWSTFEYFWNGAADQKFAFHHSTIVHDRETSFNKNFIQFKFIHSNISIPLPIWNWFFPLLKMFASSSSFVHLI